MCKSYRLCRSKGKSGISLSFCYFKDKESPIICLYFKLIQSTVVDLTKFKKIITLLRQGK